jgi:hypothetical protein
MSERSWASKKFNQILGFIAKISFKISQFPPRVKQEMPDGKERKKQILSSRIQRIPLPLSNGKRERDQVRFEGELKTWKSFQADWEPVCFFSSSIYC